MTLFLVLLLTLILFPSCSPDPTLSTRDIYLISVADDFTGGKKVLETVVSDQAALISQFQTFENVHIYSYVSQHGKRYVSIPTAENEKKVPSFKPVYKNANDECIELSSPSSSSFDHFEYCPEKGETTTEWTMDTVLEEVGKLHTGENDIIVFAYSGHGEANTGALITNANLTPNKTTNREKIIEVFSTLAGKKIFFLDSCYSGAFISSSTLNTVDSFVADEDRYVGDDYLSAIRNSTLKKTETSDSSIWIMSSAGRKQTASDSYDVGDSPFQGHYGEFTYYLLKAVGYDMDTNEAKKRTSSLTFYSIYSYVMDAMPSSALTIQTPRTSLKRLDVKLR